MVGVTVVGAIVVGVIVVGVTVVAGGTGFTIGVGWLGSIGGFVFVF